jgi:hypothetical protein
MNAIAAGLITAGGNDTTAAHTSDDQRFPLETAISEAFDGDEEGVQVEMEHCPVIHVTKYTSLSGWKTAKKQKG